MATINHQYEAPKLPADWTADEKRFYNGVIDIFDDIYRRWGRLGEKDLSLKLRTLISNKAAGETVTNLETRITQTEEELALKASSETVDALGEQVSKNTSEITLVPGKITAAVGGVQIGGRNYLMGTSQPYTAESDGAERKWLFPWACASAETARSLFGKTVTLSFDYDKAIASGSFQILSNQTWQGIVTFDAGTATNQHFERTMDFSAVSDWGDAGATAIYIDGTWNGTVTFRNMKLELGNKATDWSTAPEEVSIGSSIEMDANNVRIATGNFDVDVTGDAGDLHIDENGLSADTATFNTLNCDEVVKYYTGAASVTLGAGSDVTAISNALCNRMLTYDVTITLTGDVSGALILKGLCGSGNVTVQGASNTLNGYVLLSNNKCRVDIESLKISKTAANRQCVNIDRCAEVKLYGCILNANSTPSNAQGVRATYSGIFLHNCEFYNIPDSAMAFSYGTDALVLGCKGAATYCFWYDGATLRVAGSRPSGTCAGGNPSFLLPSDPSTITVDTGSATPAETPVTTASFTANLTGTYYPSGHWLSDNIIRQGHEGTGSNGRRDYGCMWFNASSLSGKTIKSATLTLKRVAGKGRSGTVALKLWTTTVTGKSGVMASSTLTSVGDIGTIANGETLTVSVPVSAISAIAAGGGFVLYTEETENASGKTYSRNYAHIEGTDGSAPVLTVTYQ